MTNHINEGEYLVMLISHEIASELNAPEWQAYVPVARRIVHRLQEYARETANGVITPRRLQQ
jgi:hypothetical protein